MEGDTSQPMLTLLFEEHAGVIESQKQDQDGISQMQRSRFLEKENNAPRCHSKGEHDLRGQRATLLSGTEQVSECRRQGCSLRMKDLVFRTKQFSVFSRNPRE